MSYGLDLFRGDLDGIEDLDKLQPLDRDAVLAAVQSLPDVEGGPEEFLWITDTLFVTILLADGSDGELHYVGVGIQTTGEGDPRQDVEVLVVRMRNLAQELGAVLWDTQAGCDVVEAGIGPVTAQFA